MSFGEAVRSVYGKYAAFNGRASRPEYWWFQLFFYLVVAAIYALGLIASVVTRNPAGLGFASGLLIVFVLASFVPQLAVTVRRLHDSDKSGWWMLLAFVPYVGGIVLLVFTLLTSSVGRNRYGPPYGEMPGDTRLRYYGTSREDAWSKFSADATQAAAAGYHPISQTWQSYGGGVALEVVYRGRPAPEYRPGPGGQTPRWD